VGTAIYSSVTKTALRIRWVWDAELQQYCGEVLGILDRKRGGRARLHKRAGYKAQKIQGKKMKTNLLLATGAVLTLAACSGNSTPGCTYTPLLGNVGDCDGNSVKDDGTTAGTDNGTGPTAKLLSGEYSASRIEYDASKDQLIVESLPFDDDVFEGRYNRVKAFDVPGYNAYRSTTGFDNYIAYYGNSSTGNMSTAIVGQDGYADHGHAGAGYARSTGVALPSSAQRAFYTGKYVGLRTTDDNNPFLDIIEGDAAMEADFSDGKVRGFIRNRVLKQSQSALSAGSNMALTEIAIDRDEAKFKGGSVGGTVDGAAVDGNWEGLFGGPNGEEIAGVVVITHGTYRETGTFIAEQ